MKYALYMPAGGAGENGPTFADPHTLAELAGDAERAGWDGLFLWDHIVLDWTEQTADTWIALAAAALNTSRIRLGTMVSPLPRRRPWKVARESVSLDRLSNGRLTLGVGTGLGQAEWDDLGEQASPKARGAMLDEALEVLAGLWSGQAFSYTGKYYRVKETRFLPGPLQTPRIPVWVGGFWPNKAPFVRAAHWDGVFPLFNSEGDQKLADFRACVAFVRSQRPAEGPFDIASVGYTWGADDCQPVQPYLEAGATWWMECLDPWRFGWDTKSAWPVEAMRQRVLQGPPCPKR